MHPTTLEPEELRAIKEIFDDVVAKDWFDQRQEARSGFARYLIETYSPAKLEPNRLRKIVECSARSHFSRER
jgi:hypothetical protein